MSNVNTTNWKVRIDAPLAGALEHLFATGNVDGEAKYGVRSRLIEELLRSWLNRELNRPEHPVPTLEELLKMKRRA